MAELIDKNEFIKEIEAIKFSEDAKKMKVTYDSNMDGFFKGLVEGMVGFMPTTTEADIRAKVLQEIIDRMVDEKEACHINAEFYTEKRIGKLIDFAEQLKEE